MRSVWWSRRAIGLHGAVLVAVPGFFVLGWWQLHRALSGNGLSWAYTFEWPFFAAYAIWMWWKLVHEEPATPRAGAVGGAEPSGSAGTAASELALPEANAGGDMSSPAGGGPGSFDPYDESEPELAAYNRYLASLHTADRPERS